jgi:hypothetical protein
MRPAFLPSTLTLIFGLVLLSGCATARSPQEQVLPATPPSSATVSAAPVDSKDYARLLDAVVNQEGLVDYAALLQRRDRLASFVKRIGAVDPQRFAAWSENEQIAFLVNAYNAFTLASIMERDPLPRSIRDIPGVWRLRTHRLMARPLTLDAIEHRILRRNYNEPRIHAALVCAARSCPPLRQEPYRGDRLEAQLEEQTRRWLNGSHGVRIDRAKQSVDISPIFQWFAEDWQRKDPQAATVPGHPETSAVLSFIASRLDPDQRRFLLSGEYELGYLDYDWSLNQS